MAFQIVAHFLHCKMRQPIGTSAVCILPVWRTDNVWKEIILRMPKTFHVLRRWSEKTRLFTTPAVATERASRGDRLDCGPTRWPVVALWVGLKALIEDVPRAVLDMKPNVLV
jgi:hypothetical protein